ncbi:sugar transferase [Sphingomonas sp. TX0543]|uniref:sugar transferase n=1 Tax=unclassified Sphingomonas TaxID=196159 RepID=UPI0010F7C545|nr:sugar transferase [Sphingomonas sp. 3P27F8]
MGNSTAATLQPPEPARAFNTSFHKRRIRALLYLGVILCDCAAIRSGFAVGGSLRAARWLAPMGLQIAWILLPIHIFIALRNGAVSREALQRPSESLRRAMSALILATSVVTLVMFFQYLGLLVSRVAFGVSILCSLGFICLFRLFFHICFVSPVKGGLVGELLIVDGVPSRPGAYHVFDAGAVGFVPDLNDPEALSRLAVLVEPFDRVVVSCLPERRHAWALLLKAYDLTGEIQLDQGSPLGAIGISRYHGSDTAVVAVGAMSLSNRVMKRAMDLLLAGATTIALSPLLLLVALAIKLDSRGPVFFSQVRMGRGNKPFKILKFRSMRVEATDADGRKSATPDDERVTRVGRILRMTSMDELPQIFNVLRGDMSIVGPRPHALGSLAGDKLFWEVSQKYWLRHTLKPGITGLAQVRGYRGATHEQSDLENRLQSDLEYIEGWRLWRDVTIIFNTLRVIVHPKAY